MSKLIFFHIPKTGGSSFYKILETQYNKDEIFIVATHNPKKSYNDFEKLKDKNKIKIIAGHNSLGIHKYLNDGYGYLSFFREPVDHFLSTFYYIKNGNKNNRYHQNVKDISLQDFVFSEKVKQIQDFNNYQTRVMSNSYTNNIDTENISFDMFDDSYLNKAILNIKNHFKYIFIHSEYNDSLKYLQNELGWSDKIFNVKKQNKTPDRPKPSDLSEEVKNKILEINQYDVSLFEYCLKNKTL